MTEENTNVSETAQSEAPPKPNPPDRASPAAHAQPKVVREAEHKLKEMSRKAKERKTAHNASKHGVAGHKWSKALSEVNYFWLVIGGLGALGVGYLVFGKKEPERKPRQRFKFVPRASGLTHPPGPKTPEKVPVNEPPVEKQEKPVPKFELNCF